MTKIYPKRGIKTEATCIHNSSPMSGAFQKATNNSPTESSAACLFPSIEVCTNPLKGEIYFWIIPRKRYKY